MGELVGGVCGSVAIPSDVTDGLLHMEVLG